MKPFRVGETTPRLRSKRLINQQNIENEDPKGNDEIFNIEIKDSQNESSVFLNEVTNTN